MTTPTIPINTGGPAFPSCADTSIAIYGFVDAMQGMTLRDWFAGQALMGILADPDIRIDTRGGERTQALADQSYWLADAMLKAREVQP